MAVEHGLAALARTMAATPRDPGARFEWATVVAGTGEVHVVLDSDPTGTPRPVSDNAAGPLEVGQRVHVARHGHRVSITTSPEQAAKTLATAEAAIDGVSAVEAAVADAVDRIDDAQTAANNAATEAGQALAGLAETIVSQQIEYAVGGSATVPPTTGWSTDSPTRTPGSYIWQRVRVFRANDDEAVSEPVLVTGNDGQQGEKGDKGEKGDTGSDGAPGAAGVGLESTEVSYAQTTSGTTAPTSGWTPTVPTLVKGRYLWTRSIWTYTDTSTETGYSVAYVPQDGADGDDGLPGAPGVGITDTSITYAQSTSGTTAPTSGWQAQPPPPVAGRYVWTKTVWTYSDSSTETGYSVGKIGDTGAKGDAGDTGAKGDKGDTGDQGTGVSTITSFYRLLPTGSGQPATPSGETPSGWTSTEPDYVPERDLWRSERITLSNGTYTWTTPQKSSAYAAAVHVANLADAATKGLVKVRQTDPGHYPGRIWYQTDFMGRGIGIKISVDGAWISYMLVADQLLVPSSIGAVLIKDGAVTAEKLHVDALDFKTATGMDLTAGTVTGSLVRTSDSLPRVQMDSNGLRAYNASGSTTFHLTGASGTIAGFTVTGGIIRTAASGLRAQLDSSNGGRLRFLGPGGALISAWENPTSGSYLSFRNYTAGSTAGAERVRLTAADGLELKDEGGTLRGRIVAIQDRGGLAIETPNHMFIGAPTIGGGTTCIIAFRNEVTLEASYVNLASTTAGAIVHPDDKWRVRGVSAGGMVIESALQYVRGSERMPQTTLAPNLYMATNGYVYHTTSARRWKHDIRDIGSDPSLLLDVPVRDWIDKSAASLDESYSARTPGVVAEEVEAAGLGQFVTYGQDGEVTGVMYDRLTLLLIPLIRDLRDRITTLEAHHG